MAARWRRRLAGVTLAIAVCVAGGCVAQRVSAVEGAPGGTDAAVDSGREVSVDGATEAPPADAPADAGVIITCSKDAAACTSTNKPCTMGNYVLYDNQWNCGADSGQHCGEESAYACVDADSGTVNWVVDSKQPAGNTAVLAYSAMQENFNEPPLSSFGNITVTFAENSPHVGSYEDAFDIWLNGGGGTGSTLVVIWVDTYNRTPTGTQMTTLMQDGHSYDVYVASNPSQVTLVATPAFTSGSVDLLHILQWASLQGLIPQGATLGQIELGVEIVSTGGEAATFEFGDFSIVATQ